MNKKKTYNLGSRFIFAIVLVIFFTLGFQVGQASGTMNTNTANSNSDPITEVEKLDLARFWNVWGKIQQKYVDARHIDEQTAIYGSIKGLVASLDDPYSAFMTPEETDLFQSSLNSELEGIGAELTMEDGLLVVVSPLKDSPAEAAGLKPGDIIIEIDSTETIDYSFFEAIQAIRGPRGTKVKLTVVRNGFDDPINVTITRDRIDIDSVTYEQYDEISYISINQFSDDTESEFFDAVNEALLANSDGLVLDLRFNGGGYLNGAVDLLGEFIEDDKPAVIIESEAHRSREIINVEGAQRLKDIPLVVLVNEGSASASEILAGALQDYERAFVIGATTFGKGTVQEVEMLEDGSSLRLTVAQWLTPTGRDIDENGIAPDLVVEITEEDAEEEIDPQLDKALEYIRSNLL